MTYEEALAILYTGIAPDSRANVECIELCKEAVAKQIPKRPLAVRSVKSCRIVGYDCPTCGQNVIGSGFYCWRCGQHLDWSDVGNEDGE